MKKRTIIAVIVAIALIIVGGSILAMGLSFAGSTAPPSVLTQQEVLIPESFHDVVIDTKDCDVSFVVYNGAADAKVLIVEQENVSHSVVVEDGVLQIKMTDDRNWTDHVRVFNIYGQSEPMEMTVYLPNIRYETLRITTDVGGVKIPGVLAAQEILIRTAVGDVWMEAGPVDVLDCMVSTGDITVRGGEGKKMTLRTGTGKLDVRDTTAEELHLGISTGKTEVENVIAPIFTVNGGTGDVEVENVQAKEYLQVFATTGDIDISNSDAPTVNIETDTGDITVPAAWEFQRIETGTGQVKYK